MAWMTENLHGQPPCANHLILSIVIFFLFSWLAFLVLHIRVPLGEVRLG